MAEKGTHKGRGRAKIDEDNDVFLSFINKRKRNNKKKLTEIEELEKRDQSTLKPEQLQKIKSKGDIAKQNAYWHEIKDLYYQALKANQEEGGKKQLVQKEAPKQEEKAPVEEKTQKPKREESPSKPRADVVRPIVSLIHVNEFFSSATTREEFDKSYMNMSGSLGLSTFPDLKALNEFSNHVFKPCGTHTSGDCLDKAVNHLQKYVDGSDEKAAGGKTYAYISDVVNKLAASEFFRGHKPAHHEEHKKAEPKPVTHEHKHTAQEHEHKHKPTEQHKPVTHEHKHAPTEHAHKHVGEQKPVTHEHKHTAQEHEHKHKPTEQHKPVTHEHKHAPTEHAHKHVGEQKPVTHEHKHTAQEHEHKHKPTEQHKPVTHEHKHAGEHEHKHEPKKTESPKKTQHEEPKKKEDSPMKTSKAHHKEETRAPQEKTEDWDKFEDDEEEEGKHVTTKKSEPKGEDDGFVEVTAKYREKKPENTGRGGGRRGGKRGEGRGAYRGGEGRPHKEGGEFKGERKEFKGEYKGEYKGGDRPHTTGGGDRPYRERKEGDREGQPRQRRGDYQGRGDYHGNRRRGQAKEEYVPKQQGTTQAPTQTTTQTQP